MVIKIGWNAARGVPPNLDHHLEGHHLDRARLGADLGRRLDVHDVRRRAAEEARAAGRREGDVKGLRRVAP
eukprot:311286-Prymnesium_polylepis.1